MTEESTHSPEYRARQAQRQMQLNALVERLTWSDARFLAERDAAYVAAQRSYVEPRIAGVKREMKEDNDIEEIMRRTGTDEG